MNKEKIIGTKEERKYRIGGSEYSTIINKNPYKKRIELVLEKAGVIDNTFEGNEATKRGEALENDIIAMFEDETGLIITDEQKEFKYISSKSMPLVCHVDGITSDDAVFEAKTTDINAKTWNNGIPEGYKEQLEFNCNLAKKDKAYIAVGYCKKNEIIKFEYYEYYPIKSLSDILLDCEEFTKDVKKYSNYGIINNGKTIEIKIDNNLIEELDKLKEKTAKMKAEIKPFEDRIKEIETQLKVQIGENSSIENECYKISLGNKIVSPTYEYKILRSGLKIEYK